MALWFFCNTRGIFYKIGVIIKAIHRIINEELTVNAYEEPGIVSGTIKRLVVVVLISIDSIFMPCLELSLE